MSQKRVKIILAGGFRERILNLQEMQCYKANVVKSIRETLLHKIPSKASLLTTQMISQQYT